MGARKRLPDDAIVRTIQQWRGNVTAAAEALGVAPINLRKRLVALGIDLALLRRLKDAGIHGIRQNVPRTEPMVRRGIPHASRNNSASGIFPPLSVTPTVSGVSSAVPDFPRRSERPIRVLPDLGDRIRSGRRRLSAEADSDLDDSVLVTQFIEERFDGWLSELIARVRKERRVPRAVCFGDTVHDSERRG